MNYKLSVLLVLIFFCCGSLSAQLNQYKFNWINNPGDFSNSQINCVLKDSKGFMWFGTTSGLNRYDGYSLKTFRHDIRDSTSVNNNFISNIFEGPDGKLWVITRAGLNIYNPVTETFSTRPINYLPYGLPNASISKIVKDKQSNFWFVHNQRGLFKYQTKTRKTVNITHQTRDTLSLHSNQISDMAEDPQGNFWVIHTDGVVEKLDGRTHRVSNRYYSLKKQYGKAKMGYTLFSDADGEPWIFLTNDDKGVYYLNKQKNSFVHIYKGDNQDKLSSNIVRCITQDNRGLIWIGTDHGGINLLNKKNLSVQQLLHNPDDEKSIRQNSIYVLYKDNTGIIWVGTYKAGISYYHENLIKFPVFRRQANDPYSLSFNDVNRFVEDAKGNLWIGTNGGGLIYFDRTTNRFKQFLHEPNNPKSLSNNVIVGLHLDQEQNLWIGTYFGGLNRYDGKEFKRFRHNPADPHSIADDRVWEIMEDSRHNLWVGTLGGGLDLLDRKTGKFKHYKQGMPNAVHSDYISFITEDKQGDLWIATAYGVDRLSHKTGVFTHYVNNNNNPKGLSNNNVVNVIEDSRGLIWMGTNEGLNFFDKKTNTFRSFRKEDGLPENSILGIVEDDQHNLWLSTHNGISNLIITQTNKAKSQYSFSFKNYDASDGLQGQAFNSNTFLKTRRGELIFGGVNGFNIFDPKALQTNQRKPRIALTDFQIFNQSIQAGSKLNGRVVLDSVINQQREIVLKYHENMFSVTFAALSFFQPEKNQYVYKLEGFNDQWLTTESGLRKATFTNLDPGSYTLRVKAANNDGVWNEEGIALKITVLPPFWRTNTAFGIYFIVIAGALVLGRRSIQIRERLKYRLEQEKQKARRMHELDTMKTRFFTNMSHEFRTPLTLILTPLEKIIKNAAEGNQKDQLQLIHRNARRLLNLVNQLLDFRKMEVQEIKLHPTKSEIISFIQDIAFSFSDLSEKKNISFSFQSKVNQLETYFDQDKLEKILFNLLSNAFKFTPEEGSVAVVLQVVEKLDNNNEVNKYLQIKVKDSGIGIPLEDQEKIFRRFFQHDVPDTMVNQGSGIGLAITKKFVKLHGGSIRVKSAPGQGSSFIILLPITQDAAVIPAEQPINTDIQVLSPATVNAEENTTGINGKKISKKPLVLLIEDNEDFRFYLKDNLQAIYQVQEAADGKQGWQQILAHLPDLIVSDIMMPGLDGMELSRRIKKDPRTAHIPVILLTANATEEQKMAGYATGANDYITKPFNFEILLSRIKNLLGQQTAIRQALQPKIEVKPQEIQITSLDEKLIQKALACTEKNISNPDFSVEELSRELGMSRVYLYKKLLALTGKAPLEFIRTVRLKRAAQLLVESQLTVAEVAYEVGFNSPKYFTKYFKLEFNCLPSAYASEKKKEIINV